MKQRLIRVLVYEGPSKWIQACIENRGVKGSYRTPQGGVIKEAIVGDFLEDVLSQDKEPKQEEGTTNV